MTMPTLPGKPQAGAAAPDSVMDTKAEGQPGPPVPPGANAPALDWGAGSYESVAAQLLPAARAVEPSRSVTRHHRRVWQARCPDGSDPSTLAWPSRCPAALRRRHRYPAAQRP